MCDDNKNALGLWSERENKNENIILTNINNEYKRDGYWESWKFKEGCSQRLCMASLIFNFLWFLIGNHSGSRDRDFETFPKQTDPFYWNACLGKDVREWGW